MFQHKADNLVVNAVDVFDDPRYADYRDASSLEMTMKLGVEVANYLVFNRSNYREAENSLSSKRSDIIRSRDDYLAGLYVAIFFAACVFFPWEKVADEVREDFQKINIKKIKLPKSFYVPVREVETKPFSVADEIIKLNSLLENGAISAAQFEKAKEDLFQKG